MKQIKLKRTLVPIDKLVTMAELGLGAVRPLNKEKRGWINKLKKSITSKFEFHYQKIGPIRFLEILMFVLVQWYEKMPQS